MKTDLTLSLFMSITVGWLILVILCQLLRKQRLIPTDWIFFFFFFFFFFFWFLCAFLCGFILLDLFCVFVAGVSWVSITYSNILNSSITWFTKSTYCFQNRVVQNSKNGCWNCPGKCRWNEPRQNCSKNKKTMILVSRKSMMMIVYIFARDFDGRSTFRRVIVPKWFLFRKFLFRTIIFPTRKVYGSSLQLFLFRRVIIPKVIILEGHYSERLIFRKVMIPKFWILKHGLSE